LIGPSGIVAWLADVATSVHDCSLLRHSFIAADNVSGIASWVAQLNVLPPSACDMVGMSVVPVIHCRDACGIVIALRCGVRVVYSGDTRPCDALVSAGFGASVLVHEVWSRPVVRCALSSVPRMPLPRRHLTTPSVTMRAPKDTAQCRKPCQYPGAWGQRSQSSHTCPSGAHLAFVSWFPVLYLVLLLGCALPSQVSELSCPQRRHSS
jgi:hypothetical protein